MFECSSMVRKFPHFLKGVCILLFVSLVIVKWLCKGFMAFIRNKISSGTVWWASIMFFPLTYQNFCALNLRQIMYSLHFYRPFSNSRFIFLDIQMYFTTIPDSHWFPFISIWKADSWNLFHHNEHQVCINFCQSGLSSQWNCIIKSLLTDFNSLQKYIGVNRWLGWCKNTSPNVYKKHRHGHCKSISCDVCDL